MSAFPGQSLAFRPGSIARLRESVDGGVSAPGEDGYDVEGFNTNVAHQPALVVSARNTADVRKAVEFGAAAGVPIAVQATGHGAIAADGALLVDTRHLRTVSVDPQRRTAHVAAGTRWHHAVGAAAQHGLAPLNGTALSAGVIGYTLGGGLSPLGRAFGFASDHVRSAELVAADGSVRRVTAGSDPDLLWALRGAKGNLGIVTELESGLFPVLGIYGGGLYSHRQGPRWVPCPARGTGSGLTSKRGASMTQNGHHEETQNWCNPRSEWVRRQGLEPRTSQISPLLFHLTRVR